MQEENDSDSSVDVLPEPESGAHDSWESTEVNDKGNECADKITELSDDDTSTIDLNPRKKVQVSLNTYVQRQGVSPDSLKPKLDDINAKGNTSMLHRDSKRRRIDLAKVMTLGNHHSTYSF